MCHFICLGLLHSLYCNSILKSLITYLLVLCMVIYAGGYHFVYHIYQYGLKSEMKSYLRKHKESKLGERVFVYTDSGKVTDRNFEWEEFEQEFKLSNVMYDVVSIAKTDSGLSIICIKDHDETNLEKKVNLLHQANGANAKKGSHIYRFKFQPIYSKSNTLFFDNASSVLLPNCFLKVRFYPDQLFEIPLPPPRC